MAKTNKITRSFNAGELSPLMDSRSDQQKYESGAKTMENFVPLIYGAADRRPGTEFIAAQKSSSAKGRLVGFEHSVDDTYMLLFENQVIRFFKNGEQLKASTGENTSSFPQQGSLVAHWKLNERSGTSITDSKGSHTGTSTVDASTITAAGQIDTCFDFGGSHAVEIPDSADFSFISGGVDDAFSLAAWVFVTTGTLHHIISKYEPTTDREWRLDVSIQEKLELELYDDNANALEIKRQDVGMSGGWHFITATYDGRGGADAGDGATLYVDGSPVAATTSGQGTYVDMQNLTAKVAIGARYDSSGILEKFWLDKLDNVIIWNGAELSSAEVTSLYNLQIATSAYEVTTPYLTADLPTLKFEQSADVMFITHPDYEPRRLSRVGDTSWTLVEADLQTGPFRDQNTETSQTITSDATTGTVTLTAIGHSPFVPGTIAGHEPSGSSSTSKSLTGALFKLVQAVSGTDASISEEIEADTLNDASATLFVPKGVTWDFTTNGTWGAAGDPATVVLERSYDSETTYETVVTVTSAANKNITTSGTEDIADALYRARTSIACSADTNASIQFSIRDTSHIGIVEITSVTSSTEAIGTVRTTLASTDPTHRFSEGSFSNFRGWPIDVTISAEERLTFAGNVSEPLTIWGSVIGDFTDFALGTNDDDGIQFTLVGTGQQNRIRWMLAKEALILGTVGGEHLLGASKQEEALTPTNVKAKLQTTYGSENIAAILVNQATLFVQRGGKKIREFLFNFDSDSYKADDLTVFANHITGDGIVDMAFQRTPDPTLWCIRTDGQLAALTYERDQNVFSWYRTVTNTNLAGTATASVIESIGVIFGGTRAEDEVWVTVLRQIGGSDARYVERFRPRLLPSSASDYRFLDSSITATPSGTTVSGLDHLEGQTVQVLGDGEVQSETTAGDFIVGGGIKATGVITVPSGLTTVQSGIGYDSTLVPMDLDIEGTSLTTTKRINRAIVNLYQTIGGTVGPTASKQESIGTGTSLFTGFKKISIPGGYTRDTDITIKQTEPLPMTVLGIEYDLGANND